MRGTSATARRSRTAQNPAHTYSAPGRYRAVFTVTDDDGDTSSFFVDIDVVIDGPDLVITDLTAMQSGDSLIYEVTLKNQGGDHRGRRLRRAPVR